MNYVGKLLSNVKGFYNEINSATLTGAIDVVIVRQEDGSYISSPWHVRFGKMGVLRAREKLVDIEINGEVVDLHMKLGEGGAAFFVQEAEETAEVPAHLATSPLPSTLELMEAGLAELKQKAAAAAEDEEEEATEATTPTPTNAPSLLPPTLSLSDLPDEHLSSHPDIKLASNLSCGNLQPLGSPPLLGIKRNKSASNMATQTEMTATEVESRTPSGEHLQKHNSNVSSGESPANQTCATTTTQTASVDLNTSGTSHLTVENETQTHGATNNKIKRRKKRRGAKKTDSVAAAAPACPSRDGGASGHLEVTSGSSSAELPEEALFDLELSSDEESAVKQCESSMVLPSMGRTVSMPIIDERLARTEEWASSQFASAFHPFSDGDITPIVSPVGSRPPSPKSDTEYETQKYDAQAQTQLTGADMEVADEFKWAWGELPTSQPPAPKAATPEEEKPSSGGLLSFMRKTKKVRHQPEQEGIYLDDLNLEQMDPEVAALYLYHGKGSGHSSALRTISKDEDSESGRGASLPQSPLTVQEKEEEEEHTIVRPTPQLAAAAAAASQGVSEVAMSLCGGLKAGDTPEITPDKFVQYLITYEQFCENPSIINNPNLVIRIEEKYYNWQIGGPMIMSWLAFQRPLTDGTVDSLCKLHMPAPKGEKRRGWGIWPWRGGTEDSTHAPQTNKKEHETQTSPPSSAPSSVPGSPAKSPLKLKKQQQQLEGKEESSDDESNTSDKSAGSSRPEVHQQAETTKREKFKKSLKLTSVDILKLGLKEGLNEASFSVTTQYQGTCRCNCYIYVWSWDDRIVVSDIDGTITRSDVLGHVLPMIGKDWSQAGIANLYNMVYRNGYKFVYLSARAIGQSRITRDYLRSVRQKEGGGELSLPEGPLLLSPSSLISAFHKEVIERKPEEFKISCLRDIAALFPPATNPFYCGFGNKVNDVWAYRAVGIPISRVFTVNHKGELRMELHSTFQSSYSKMSDIVDHFFPPLLDRVAVHTGQVGKVLSGNFPEAQQYSTFTYWREPLPDIADELLGLKGAGGPSAAGSREGSVVSLPSSPAASSSGSGSKEKSAEVSGSGSHVVTVTEGEPDKK